MEVVWEWYQVLVRALAAAFSCFLKSPLFKHTCKLKHLQCVKKTSEGASECWCRVPASSSCDCGWGHCRVVCTKLGCWHTVLSVYFQWHFSACFYCCIFPEYLCRRRGAHVIFWIRFLRFSFRKCKLSALKTKGKMLHPKCNRFLIQLRAGTSVTARSISVYSWRKLPSSGAMESWQAPEKTPLLIYLLPVLFYSSSTFMHSSLHTLTVREACTGLRWNLRPLEPLVWHLSSSRQEETPYQVCLKAAMNIEGSGLMTCSQGGGGTWTAWSEMTEWRINRVICLDYSSQGQLTDPSVASTLRLTRTSNTHATQLFIQMTRWKKTEFWSTHL